MPGVYYPECRIVIVAYFENFGIARERTAFDAIPHSVTITRNSFRQADSWEIEFNAKDFPIPPSLVKSAAVEIYLYDKKGLLESKDSQRVQLELFNNPSIVGLVDTVETIFGPDGRTVLMGGQDYTALFMEHDFQRVKRNFNNQRLDRVLNTLIREVDPLRVLNLRIERNNVNPSPIPVIGRGSAGRTNHRGFPARRGTNYWDYMYDLAIKHGWLLYVDGIDVVLAEPRSILEEPSTIYELKWGLSVESVHLDRKLGRERVPQVEAISYDPKTRKRIIGTYPTKKQKVTVGIGTKRNEIATFPIRGIVKKEVLNRVAELQYLLLSQGEQRMELVTRELRDDLDDNLLRIKAGDGLLISFDPFNREIIEKQPEGSRVKWLTDRGWTPQAAQFTVKHLTQLNTFRRPFFVREAQLDWSKDDGFSLQTTLCNFVVPDGLQKDTGEVSGRTSEEIQ